MRVLWSLVIIGFSVWCSASLFEILFEGPCLGIHCDYRLVTGSGFIIMTVSMTLIALAAIWRK